MDDQVGQFVQAESAAAEWFECLVSTRAFLLGHAVRGLQTIDRGESDFLLYGVLAGGLAESRGGFFDIQNVVHDLEGQADVFAIAGEGGVPVLGGASEDGA